MKTERGPGNEGRQEGGEEKEKSKASRFSVYMYLFLRMSTFIMYHNHTLIKRRGK